MTAVVQYQSYQIYNEVDRIDVFERDNHELRHVIQHGKDYSILLHEYQSLDDDFDYC